MKPHAAGIDAFSSGELRKSFSSGSLNRTRELSGGGSGYRSEARKPTVGELKYKVVGDIPPSKVAKTIIHYVATISEEGQPKVKKSKSMSKGGYVPKQQAFTMIPFVFKVVYEDIYGKTMTITNTNIR